MKKMVIAIIIILLISVGLSGCTSQESSTGDNGKNTVGGSESFTKTSNSEEKTVDSTGVNLSYLDRHIYVDVPENSVSGETTITVTELSSYPAKSDVTFLNAYEFEPDGIIFDKPVTIRINFKRTELPDGVDDAFLKLYMYNNGNWNEIVDSGPVGSYVVGEVSHFCSVATGFLTDYVADPKISDERDPDEEGNNSAIITFEVPVTIVDWHSYPQDAEGNILYDEPGTLESTAVIHWEPQPYVRYYEFSLNFNGNPPDGYQVGCEWSERNEDWCGFHDYNLKEYETYYLGDHYSIVGVRNYVGLYDNFSPTFHGLIGYDDHGKVIGSVYEFLFDNPDISDIEKENIHNEMSAYIHTFFDGWTATVRAVS